jgi:UDP-N-acetylglucosamine 2-epimerase
LRANSTDIVAFAIHYLDLDLLPKVGLLSLAHIVLTGSGGIQEEAPLLGKPVLVMRDTTERPEGVLAGTDRPALSGPGGMLVESWR